MWPACRAGLSILLPLLLLLWLDRLDLMAGALFGGFVSLYGRGEPYLRRARTLAAIGAGLIAAVAAGGMVSAAVAAPGWREITASLVLAVFASVSTVASNATKLGPPGGLIFAFAVGACAHLPMTWGALSELVTIATASAVLGWLLSLAGALVDTFAPQRRAVGRATRRAAEYLERGDQLSWQPAATAVRDAWHSLALTTRKRQTWPTYTRLADAISTCEAALASPTPDQAGANSLRALGRSLRRASSEQQAAERAGHARDAPREPTVLPTKRSHALRGTVAATVRGRYHEWGWVLAGGARVAVASLLATAAANLLGIGHAYWAAVSAVAVLQINAASRSLPRLLQRSAGTIIGVILGAVVLYLEPAAWVGVLAVAGFQWAAEMTVLRNYALGVSFATPVALLASTLPMPNVEDNVAVSRLLATLLGAAVAIVIVRLVPNRAASLARFDRALGRVHELSNHTEIHLGRIAAALAELRESYDALAGETSNTAERAALLAEAARQAYRQVDTDSPADDVNVDIGAAETAENRA